MASAAALQYPQPAGLQTYSSPDRFPRAPFSGGSSYASNAASFSPQTLPYSRPYPSRLESPTSVNAANLGAAAAARSMTDHSKPHKRSSIGSSKSSSGAGRPFNSSFGQNSSVGFSDNSHSQRAVAKDRFKSNFKKLTQQKNEDRQTTLDLSKTAEENEKRSGLGIYSLEPSSPSSRQLNFASPSTDLNAHSRNISHGSQYSAASGPFKPSAPFVIPLPRPQTPSLPAASYSPTAISSGDPYLEGLSTLSHEVTFDTSVNDSPSPVQRPDPRVKTPDSNSPTHFGFTSTYPAASPKSKSLQRSQQIPARSRRGTNQSSETAMTSKSRTSIDRAFSFLTRSASGAEREKDDSMDPMTRAASIQAARQAFQEKEEAKAKKYELREQKAAEKAQKKRDTTGLGRTVAVGGGLRSLRIGEGKSSLPRAKVGSRTTAAPTTASAIREKAPIEAARVPSEYVDMPAGPAPEKGDNALRERRRERKKPTKAATVKTRYLRFISWLRTKLLNLGNGRRR